VAVLALREPNGHLSTALSRTSASSVAKQTAASPAKGSPSRGSSPSGGSSSGGSSSASSPDTGHTAAGSGVKDVPLVVLNNTTIHGLAVEAAQRFESGGWTVSRWGNLSNVIISTCAYYDESDPTARPAAEALKAQYPAIKRVEPKFAELPAGPVVVVLTPDYTAA
jgi:hypothetical protein